MKNESIAPTPAQAELLAFFGKPCPAKAWDASRAITEILADSLNARRWVVERARRYVGRMELRTATSTLATYNVVRVLLHGFGLGVGEARPILEEWNSRCAEPRESRELEHKLHSVDAQVSQFPRGYLVGDLPNRPNAETRKANGILPKSEAVKKVEFSPEKLTALAAPWRDVANLVWLGNRSAMDPAPMGRTDFLAALYGGDRRQKILVFTDYYSQGQAVWPDEPVPETGRLGVWFLPAPVDGLYHPNPRSKGKPGTVKMSRRSEESVTNYRYLLLESDRADMRDWLGFIVQVPLPIEAIYTSGGRSIHALVRMDCPTKAAWEAEKKALLPFLMGCVMVGGDRGVLSGVRLSRLPGCWREGSDSDGEYRRFAQPKPQKLLFVRPDADDRPICDLPALRDVEKIWCERATRVVDGHEPEQGTGDGGQVTVETVKSALGYYANVSKACRAALEDLA